MLSSKTSDITPQGLASHTARGAWVFKPDMLIIPLLAVLLIVFVVPIVWFMFSTFRDVPHPLLFIGKVLRSATVLHVLWITNWLAFVVTAVTLLLAYPVAYVLCRASRWQFTLIFISIIIPYFTSVIVRTYAWMVILGRSGLINEVLLRLGWIHAPLNLMYNKLGVVIGMTYVLLPYLVLTLLAAMKGIDVNLMRAARGLGASATYTFFKVYLPLSMHGVISGCLIVFILALGYFVTPALMGGPSDVMIAMLIEHEVELTFNWPLAAALSVVLLIATLLLYTVYYRFTRLDRMMR